MVENQPPKPRAAGATGGGPGLGFHYLQGMLSSLLWQPCRQGWKQALLSVKRLPRNVLGVGLSARAGQGVLPGELRC